MSILIQLAIGLCMFAPSVLIPNFLQQLQGHTPSQAGVLMAARGAGSVAAMLIAGRIADKVDTRAMMLAGLLVTAAAIWQMSYFSLSTPPVYILLTGLAQGLGMPLAFLPISFVAFSTLPDSSRAEGSMLMTLARSMGGSAGVTASVAYVSHSAQVNSSYIAEHFTPFAVDRWAMVGDSPGANAATALLMAEIDRQALSIAYVNNFRLLAILVLCCTPLLLLFRRSARHPTEADRVIDAH
jgi:DHA2 family multidrug resistance protein